MYIDRIWSIIDQIWSIIDQIWSIIDQIWWIKIQEYASKMVVIFDEEQFHHGDEPYTYSNLT